MKPWYRRLEVDVAGVLGLTGVTLVVMGAAQLLPALVAFSARSAVGWPLLLGALGCAGAGGALLPLRHRARKWTRRESLAVVAGSWAAAVLAAAVPYVVSGACGPVDALVESASGLTTTGATIFPDVDGLGTARRIGPTGTLGEHVDPLHLWRALSHWLGGAGIVLVVLVVAPWLGEAAEALRRTQRAEASFLTERYRGSTSATLKGLLAVYVGATGVETLLLVALGMAPWDALLHSFATISTGGFSTRTASLGAWGPAVQLVVVVFMIVGALNFAVLGRVMDDLLALWRRARQAGGLWSACETVALRSLPLAWRTLWRSGEVRGYLLLLAACSLVCSAFLLGSGDVRYSWTELGPAGVGSACVDATFTVVSIATTTGFGGSADYEAWPPACQAILLGLMVVGGCTGSTAGGIKFRRLALVTKYAVREVRRLPRPGLVLPIRLAGAAVPEQQVREALGYTAVYFALLLLFALGIAASGSDLASAGAASVSSMGSIGPGFGDCGPSGSFQPYAASAKLLCVIAMLLGRLEIFAPLAVALPGFWLRPGRVRGAAPRAPSGATS